MLQISGNGLGETELNQEEVDCELERRYCQPFIYHIIVDKICIVL